jgi:formamidopyrimidine-DNA glycosylase
MFHATVARIVHYLRNRLVGKTLATVQVQDDANVYGKGGTTAAEFKRAMTGKKVLDARQQGKYFWYDRYMKSTI